MARTAASSTPLAAALVLALGAGGALNWAFAPTPRLARSPQVARASSYDSGKVNLGVEFTTEGDFKAPEPIHEVNEATTLAIMDCLEEGCSVEAIMALDAKLARDEDRIVQTMGEVSKKQKTEFSEDAAEALAWFDNTLKRTGTLRAQLQALKGITNNDFVQQMVKAASVAFGGNRHGEYPKVGVSPYSS